MQGETTPASAQTEQTPQPAHPHHFTSALFHHQPHLHQPRNINLIHEAEKAAAGFNQRVAVGMTQVFQSMITFWVILTWIVGWILLNFLPLAWDRLPWPLLLCLASVPQLPLMIVIMVGQGLLGRKQELQADEQFRTTMSTYHDIEEIMKHLAAQDAELLRHAHMLIHLLEKNGISLQQLATEGATNSYLSAFVQPQPVGGDSAAPVLAEGEKPTT
jgi:uncharacterized membrane protein